jgi:hypothetical protein
MVISFSSCMHLIVGEHGDKGTADSPVERHITVDNVEVIAVVPIVENQGTSVVSVVVHRADSKDPISRAEVGYHWMPMPTGGHAHDNPQKADTMIDGLAAEPNPGRYTFELPKVGAGRYLLSVTVKPDSTTAPLSFEVERNVSMKHGMGMMGMGSTADSWVIGGALMAAMMVAMWAVRVGM